MEDLRTGIARNRLQGLSLSWLTFDMGVFISMCLTKTPAKISSSSKKERFEFLGQSEHETMSPRKATLPSDAKI